MLSSTILLLLTANLLATWIIFNFANKLYHRINYFPLAQPLILSGLILVALLTVFDIPIEDYQQNSQVIMMMLAPATVALGVPLYKNIAVLVKYKNAILIPLLSGAFISPCSALLVLWLLGGDDSLLLSMISKSITSPIAIDITKIVGGIPTIAVIFVIISGIIGSALAAPLFSFLAIKHDISKGLSLGIASHHG